MARSNIKNFPGAPPQAGFYCWSWCGSKRFPFQKKVQRRRNNKSKGTVIKRGLRAFQNFCGLINSAGTDKVTVRMAKGINVYSSLYLSWKGVILFHSYQTRKRCISGEIIESRVWLERRSQDNFKTYVSFSVGPVQLKLQPEWQGVSMYLSISLLKMGSSLSLLVDLR